MTKREFNFCFELAKYMLYPNSIEIGGASSQFKDVIREITKGNKSIRQQVFDICEEFVLKYCKFDSNVYKKDSGITPSAEEVLEMIKEDYNQVFF